MNPVRIAFDSQRYMPWTEKVTVTQVRPNAVNVVVPDVRAGVYQQGTSEAAPSRGVALAVDITVTIGLDAVPFEPGPWDQVTWRGRVYTVQRENRSLWLRFYTLTCKDLIIAFRLAQLGSLLRPADDADDGGKRIPGLTTVLATIPCRVQPLGGQVGENLGALTSKAPFRCYLGQQVQPQADDVWQVGDKRYAIVGSGNNELIDQIPYLDLMDIDQGQP